MSDPRDVRDRETAPREASQRRERTHRLASYREIEAHLRSYDNDLRQIRAAANTAPDGEERQTQLRDAVQQLDRHLRQVRDTYRAARMRDELPQHVRDAMQNLNDAFDQTMRGLGLRQS